MNHEDQSPSVKHFRVLAKSEYISGLVYTGRAVKHHAAVVSVEKLKMRRSRRVQGYGTVAACKHGQTNHQIRSRSIKLLRVVISSGPEIERRFRSLGSASGKGER